MMLPRLFCWKVVAFHAEIVFHPLQNPSEAAKGTHRVSSDASEGGDERWAREKGESGHQGGLIYKVMQERQKQDDDKSSRLRRS